MTAARDGLTILGVFVADTAFRANRLPLPGETIAGSGFDIGPGGKGSNQSIAAARAGADVRFISKIGKDTFGDMALAAYAQAGVTPLIERMDTPTGAAFVFIDDLTGDNAIIVYPGASGTLDPADVEQHRTTIEASAIFLTQMEQPAEAAKRGLEIAAAAGVTTILNPSPAQGVDPDMLMLCDFVIPNEGEAAALVGFDLVTPDDCRRAGDALLAMGAGAAIITLGARGALLHERTQSVFVASNPIGKVIDTSGAGDAFLGACAAALSRGQSSLEAVQFGCAAAAIAVTRKGTAAAAPVLEDILEHQNNTCSKATPWAEPAMRIAPLQET